MMRASGVRLLAVALVFLLFPQAPSALSPPLAPLHPLCLHPPRSSLVSLRGGGKPDSTKAFRSGKAGTAAAGGAKKESTQEALYQLTTQLFGSGAPTGKKDLYEILEVNKKANVKEIRDSYYKLARKWHPDKNQEDPNAEARFKLISEAYEILSDPAKRKVYDESGREGLEAHNAFANVDFKGILRSLFGGGEFDSIFGDVCELPLVKTAMKSNAEENGDADDEDEDGDPHEKRERAEAGRKRKREQEAEEEGLTDAEKKDKKEEREMEEAQLESEKAVEREKGYCLALGEKLMERLRPRVDNTASEAEFAQSCREWAKELSAAPGGLDLVRITSMAWRNRARRYARRFFGLEGVFYAFKEFSSRVGQGFSLLMGALRASRMTREAIAKQKKDKAKESKDPDQKEKEGDEKMAEGEKIAAGEDEEEDGDVNIGKEDMMQIAKVGLDVVWRLGCFLLQERVRRVVRSMMEEEEKRLKASDLTPAEQQEKLRAVATSLFELGHHFKVVWEEEKLLNPAKVGSPISIGEEDMKDDKDDPDTKMQE